MKFSLPYIDQPKNFWNSFRDKYYENLDEVYFPIEDHIIPSGRPVQQNSRIYSFLENSDLPKAVLVNPIILPKPLPEIEDSILNELERLYSHFGVVKVTVTDPLLCRAIKQNLKYYKVCASTLMRIKSPEQLVYIEDYVDSIALDTSITRNIGAITNIRENYKGEIKLIVNEGCLEDCPYRTQHFFEMGSSDSYPESLCENLLNEKPWLSVKSAWILPQHLHYYNNLYDIIKLAGRVTLQEPDKYLKVINAYLNKETLIPSEIGCGPAGLKEDIPITDDFFYKTITCDKNCTVCDYCEQYYLKNAKVK